MPRASATQHELARVQLLAGLPGQTLLQLSKRMEREEVPPGHVVVREGEPGDRFYVVFAGMLRVAQRDLGRRGGGPGAQLLREGVAHDSHRFLRL